MSEQDASYETKDEALKSDGSFVTFWLDAIDASSKEEKDWRTDAQNVLDIYRGDDKDETEFNIVYSNVETLLPAIYNSTPVPDVRRRFGDKDKIAKVVADMLERGISYSLDSYDFDNTMRNVLFDSAVPGRGLARVRYIPYMGEDEQVAYEEATCEYVPWKHFRHGAARVWDEVPWIAFEHFLSRDQLRKLNPELADQVQLDCSTKGEDAEGDPAKGDIFRRARVWEIWDKDNQEVVFIATGYRAEAISRQSDPLGLTGFYPAPRPVQPISTPGKLCPVTPYAAYKTLAEELNSITLRIRKLVRQIRVKAGYASMGADLDALARADDGELVPLENLEAIAAGGGDINKLLAWWPIEPQVKALAQLYVQREQIKQTIYEVTGISDIVRGSTAASETATAQQIKSQWGSLRIQRLQAEVQRFARDLFRLKAEIFATKFDIKNLSMITGIPLLPMAQLQQAQQMAQQAQQMQQPVPPQIEEALKAAPLEQVEQIMKSDLMRSYKIDVESDSTIRADLTRNQEQMSFFVQGTAQYMQAAMGAVQAGMPVEPLVEIYSAFARNFKLGKQAEDALDRLGEQAREPKPPQPDPEMEKAKMTMQMEQMKLQSTQQLEQAKLSGQMQMEQVKLQGQMQLEQAKMELEREKVGMQLGFEQQKMQADYTLRSSAQDADIAIKREGQAADQELAREAQSMTPAQNGDTPGPRSKKATMGPIGDAIKALGEMMIAQNAQAEQRHAESMEAIAAGQAQMMQVMAAPQKVIRDRNGQIIGAAKDIRVN
jgi:hypothetical protein